tara:strand:- start:177 stop:2252 length:2076 start_codon:yes stop_codon:yes gene_type:complete
MVKTRSQSLKNEYFKKNTKESIDMVNKDNTNSDMTKFLLRDNIPTSDSEASDDDKNIKNRKKVVNKKTKELVSIKSNGKKKEKKNKEIKPKISIDMSNVFQKLIKKRNKKTNNNKINKEDCQLKKVENKKKENNDEEINNDKMKVKEIDKVNHKKDIDNEKNIDEEIDEEEIDGEEIYEEEIDEEEEINEEQEEEEEDEDEEEDSEYEYDSEEENEESDDDIFERDEYDIPTCISSNNVMTQEFNNIKEYIEECEPKLDEILQIKCDKKEKRELFELFYIYKYLPGNSDERYEMKKFLEEKIKNMKQNENLFNKHSELIDFLNKKTDNSELNEIKTKILDLEASNEIKTILYRRFKELENSEIQDEDYYKNKQWINNSLKLPYNKYLNFKIEDITKTLCNIKAKLDNELYGMNDVKEQILLFINNKFHNPTMKGCSLGLIGPPGVGKTSIAMCLSNILSVPFEQISLGGMIHADTIKGHDSTYVGSKPGLITQALMRMEYKNGILFFDEFDKIDDNKEIVSTLLHVTDFQQNHKFHDNYFDEIDIDLSSLWFIYSMNSKPTNPALADRVFYVKVDGYNLKEKVKIIKDYTLPKILKNLGISKDDICICEESARYLIQKISNEEKGIRILNQKMNELISKIIFLKSNKNELNTSFKLPEKYFPLTFPINIDSTIIDNLLKVEKNLTLYGMYV